MSTVLKSEASFLRDRVNAIKETATVDPAKLQKWLNFIMQILPVLLTLFASPAPNTPQPPSPPPVQALADVASVDELIDHVEKQVAATGLSEIGQMRLFNAIESLSYGLFQVA